MADNTTIDNNEEITVPATGGAIGMDTRLVSANDLTVAPNGEATDMPGEGTLDRFTTRKELGDYDLTVDKRADVDANLANNFTLYDAVRDTPIGQALTTLDLSAVNWKDGPGDDLNNLDIDSGALRASVNASTDISEDDKVRYNKAVNIIANAQNKGMSIVRASDGRYWIESNEGGRRNYAINGLLDIKSVIDKFHGKAPNDTIEEDTPEIPKVVPGGVVVPEEGKDIPDEAIQEFNLNEAEQWYLASFVGDVVTTVGGMAFKGAAGAGSVLSFIGGLASTAADARGDYLSGKSWGDIGKNAAVRVGLEAAEAVSFLPVSLIAKLKKGAPVAKIIRRGMTVIMAGNAIDVATKTRWKELFEKDFADYDIDDWREMTRAITAVAGLAGGALANKQRGNSIKKAHAADAKVATPKTPMEMKDAMTADNLGIKPRSHYDTKNAPSRTKHDNATNKLQEKQTKNTAEATDRSNTLLSRKQTPRSTTLRATPGNKQNAHKNTLIESNNKNIDNSISKTKADVEVKNNKLVEKEGNIKKDIDTKEVAGKEAAGKERTKDLKTAEDKAIADNKDVATLKGKSQAAIDKARADNVEAFGNIRGGNVNKKGALEAGVKTDTKAPKYDKVKVKQMEAVNKASKKKLKEVEKDLLTDSKNNKLKKKRETLRKKIVKNTEKIGKEKLNKKSLWKRGVKGASDGFDVAGTLIVPNKNFASHANLKSIANSDVMKGDHNVPKTDKAANMYLKNAGFKQSEIAKLTLEQKQNAFRYIRYNQGKIERKKIGGKLEGMTKLVSKGKVLKAQNGLNTLMHAKTTNSLKPVSNDPTGGTFDKVYVDKAGNPVDYMTDTWYTKGNPGFIYSKNPITGEIESGPRGTITPFAMSQEAIDRGNLININGVAPEITQEATDRGKLLNRINGNNTIFNNPGELTKDELAEKARAKSKAELDAITAKYNALRAQYGIPQTPSNNNDQYKILDYVKPSDIAGLFQNNRIKESYTRADVHATTAQTLLPKNMSGLEGALNQTNRGVNVDSADWYAKQAIQQRAMNSNMENRGKLIERNNEYVDRQRMANIATVNRNSASVIQAMNQNILASNRDRMMSAQSRLQARTAERAKDNKLIGNIGNRMADYGRGMAKKNHNDKFTADYNKYANLAHIYNTEYMPAVQQFSLDKDVKGIMDTKSKFMQKYNIDPDDIDAKLRTINSSMIS